MDINGPNDVALPSPTKSWASTLDLKWLIVLAVLLIAPLKNSYFEYNNNPHRAYAELRIPLSDQVLILAKNSGSRKISLMGHSYRLHALRLVDSETSFLAHTPGTIPANCYSVAVVPLSLNEVLAKRARLDDDAEFEPERLRITTPVEESQYIVAVAVIAVLAAVLATLLNDYRRIDSVAMSGRR